MRVVAKQVLSYLLEVLGVELATAKKTLWQVEKMVKQLENF